MENNASSVIIKVHDIDICRSFYRNIMNMGDPIVNSSFRVEFIMANNATLILSDDKDIQMKQTTSTPCIEISERISDICQRLDELECKYEFVKRNEKDIYRMRDPENRPILFTGDITSAQHHRPKHCRTARRRSAENSRIRYRKPQAAKPRL